MARWECTECGVGFEATEADFPISCCEVEYEFPLGMVDETAARKRPRRKRKRRGPKPVWPHGDELAKLLKQLGARETAGCRCRAMVRNMNIWGPRCRNHKAVIVAKLKDAYDHSTWADAVKFRALAAATGIAWELKDWSDPYGSLVDLAIERAEATAAGESRG